MHSLLGWGMWRKLTWPMSGESWGRWAEVSQSLHMLGCPGLQHFWENRDWVSQEKPGLKAEEA